MYSPKHTNFILSKNHYLDLDNRMNGHNILLIGDRSEITEDIIMPNIIEGDFSFICTIPSEKEYYSAKDMLKEKGFRAEMFNLNDAENTFRYDPLDYIHDDQDALMFAVSAANIAERYRGPIDPYWIGLINAYLSGVIQVIKSSSPEKNGDIAKVVETLQKLMPESNNPGSDHASSLSAIEASLMDKAKGNEHLTRLFNTAFHADSRYRMSVLRDLINMLSPLRSPSDVSSEYSQKSLDLESFASEKTALYIVDTNSDITCLIYSQLLDIIEKRRKCGNNPKHCIMYVDKRLWNSIPEIVERTESKENNDTDIVLMTESMDDEFVVIGQRQYSDIIGEACNTKVYFDSSRETARWMAAESGCYSHDVSADEYSILDLPYDKCVIKKHGEVPIIDARYSTEKSKGFALKTP